MHVPAEGNLSVRPSPDSKLLGLLWKRHRGGRSPRPGNSIVPNAVAHTPHNGHVPSSLCTPEDLNNSHPEPSPSHKPHPFLSQGCLPRALTPKTLTGKKPPQQARHSYFLGWRVPRALEDVGVQQAGVAGFQSRDEAHPHASTLSLAAESDVSVCDGE